MSWVTTLGPNMAQVEYRLSEHAGCGLDDQTQHGADDRGADAQVGYRLNDGELPLEWVGDGLREVGIKPGTAMFEEQKDWARALMNGAHPGTGEVLVAPKLAVDPRAKLPVVPLLDVLDARAKARGIEIGQLLAIDPRAAEKYVRALRGVARHGEHHKMPVTDLVRISTTAGIDLADVYAPEALAQARRFADARVPIGNRGYDLTFDLPKSYSVLFALASPALAKQLEDTYLEVVRETIGVVQEWAAYGMRGHHGDGHTATRVGTSGFLGWMMTHRTARPVGDAPPDPHLHAHVILANLVRGRDGQWSTVAAGGRDLHRHARAADSYLKARLRQVSGQRFGLVWERDPETGAWEVGGIPAELRGLFSKRSGQVEAELMDWFGLTIDDASVAQVKAASARSRQPNATHSGQHNGLTDTRWQDTERRTTNLRSEWVLQVRSAGFEPAAVVDAVTHAAAGATASSDGQRVQMLADTSFPDVVDEVVDRVFRPDEGLTAHTKVFTRADLLAEVMHALPLLDDLGQAEQVADAIAQESGWVVALPDRGPTHLSNHARYTTVDITGSERLLLEVTRDRYDSSTAILEADRFRGAADVFETSNGFTLTDEQQAVLHRLATGGHGVDAVIGVAGSGKTTIMSVLRAAYETEGKTVAGVCVAAVAAQNLQAETGIGSTTVAALKHQIRQGVALNGADVLVLDEAAMVDDRDLASILARAKRTGTKVIAVGDPLQLRAPGVGGGFAAIHQLVDGLQLSQNRRQQSIPERQALRLWREGKHSAALNVWTSAGRIHTTITAAEAHAGMLAAWNRLRLRYADVHDRIANLLLLAGTNAEVDRLNTAAQQIRLGAGELTGPGRTYTVAGGNRIRFHVGDQVMLRINQRGYVYSLDLLNGYRGVITGIDPAGNVTVQWRHTTPDGPALAAQAVTPAYIRTGGLSLAYAITVAKAQGLTTGHTLVYGNTLDPHTLYPAMSRNRQQAHLWLSLDELETDTDRARHGEPATPAEAQHRAIAAYTRQLAKGGHDRVVLAELEHVDLRPPRRYQSQPPQHQTAQVGTETVTQQANQLRPDPETQRQVARAMTPPVPRQPRVESAIDKPAAGSGADALRRHRYGSLTDEQLTRAIGDTRRLLQDSLEAQTAAQAAQQAAVAGRGPHAEALRQRRKHLAAAAAFEEQAEQAYERMRRAWIEVNTLYRQLDRKPLALWLAGVRPDKLREQIAELRDHIQQQQHMVTEAEWDAREIRTIANLGGGAARDTLRKLENAWNDHLRAAIDNDVQAAAAMRRRAHIRQATTGDLDELRQEQQRRDHLTPKQTNAENAIRAKVVAAQAAQQHATRAAAERYAAEQYARQLSRDLSRGHSHER